jgi:hypothetical protein
MGFVSKTRKYFTGSEFTLLKSTKMCEIKTLQNLLIYIARHAPDPQQAVPFASGGEKKGHTPAATTTPALRTLAQGRLGAHIFVLQCT